MNHANLTARYRPQTFADLAGQETVRAILSRAAAEDRVAPAYLFSGTRGVGKTTVARIFAKALNCASAPAAEPCNACDRCRQITAGTAVDVVEIDGASNRGIDDVRRLKEVVGYAPMEGRYRVFIIDEAHMLSRDAFNALLKTLEEPPARVTFILATTESHKFPATILSRCQHYVFKRLPESGLEAHLAKVLGRENVSFDGPALRLLARRAAGSVRDAMSLLGQVLALGGTRLTEDDTRHVLGLAGQELLFTLFTLLREGDAAGITRLVAQMLDSGLDLGFFLREMAASWRNMFILREAGDKALSVLDIPAPDADRWREEAAHFELSHIHAAWQMSLDGQRRVLTSLEPALALELLLLNIAMLPRLLPLESVSRLARSGGGAPPPPPRQAPGNTSSSGGGGGQSGVQRTEALAEQPISSRPTSAAPSVASIQPVIPATQAPARTALPDDCSWSAFLRFCKQQEGLSASVSGIIRGLDGQWEEGVVKLAPGTAFCSERLEEPEIKTAITALLHDYYGGIASLVVLPPPAVKSPAEIKEDVRAHPAVQLFEREMGAHIVDYGTSPETAGPVQ